jgi:hypothetical protein
LIPNGRQTHGSHSSPTCPGNAARGTSRTVPTLRLAKATLTLIPVMGMQNLLFILIPSQGVEYRTIEIRNLIEQSLEAYSGILGKPHFLSSENDNFKLRLSIAI